MLVLWGGSPGGQAGGSIILGPTAHERSWFLPLRLFTCRVRLRFLCDGSKKECPPAVRARLHGKRTSPTEFNRMCLVIGCIGNRPPAAIGSRRSYFDFPSTNPFSCDRNSGLLGASVRASPRAWTFTGTLPAARQGPLSVFPQPRHSFTFFFRGRPDPPTNEVGSDRFVCSPAESVSQTPDFLQRFQRGCPPARASSQATCYFLSSGKRT